MFLDFDGTLSPIVDDPFAARPSPGAVDALHRLVARYAVVAVISGRSAEFLATHLPVSGLQRWGLYGLEYVGPDGEVADAAELEPWLGPIAAVAADAEGHAPAGVVVENKGAALGLHWREAPAAEATMRAFAAEVAARTGLRIHEAKMSVELRPPVEVDKGVIVRRVMRDAGLAAGCFVGDDVGDLPAFAALGEFPRPLRVAVRSSESPPELLAVADTTVAGPEGVLELMEALAGP